MLAEGENDTMMKVKRKINMIRGSNRLLVDRYCH
jgi:hypothetical protein